MDLTIKLMKPVAVDGETHETLTLQELNVDQIILLDKQHGSKPTSEQDKYFYAQSCGVTPDVIGKLGSRDWTRLKNRYWSTLGNVEQEPETAE